MNKTKGKTTCDEFGRPNVSKYVMKKLATLSSTTRKPRHLRKEGGKKANNGQLSNPDFSLMGDFQKKAFDKALVTNSDSANEFKQYVKTAKLAKEEDNPIDDANITCSPSIAVLNADVGAYHSFPVNIDGNLARIKFIVGGKNTKGVPLTDLWYLIDL